MVKSSWDAAATPSAKVAEGGVAVLASTNSRTSRASARRRRALRALGLVVAGHP